MSNICPQLGSTSGFEDSLYLNVYTQETEKTLLPVMFWINGGSFYSGNSNSDENGPDYLMDKDVILVTINYRLGALGLF